MGVDGGKANMGLPLLACLALLVQLSSAATSHVVGDSTGWTIPTSTSFYSTWASKQTFFADDFLVFNFPSGVHTVAEVTKSDYESCATSSPITQVNNGPANLSISSASTHYYICTIAGHCSGGQKLAITASAAASTSPPASSPAPKSAAAPTPKSAPSPTTAPSPKSATTPAASPTPKSSPAAPTPSPATAPPPSSGAPKPATSAPSPTPASAPGPSAAGSPESAAPGPSSSGSPETAPTPSAGSGPSSPPPAVAGSPPAPPGSPTGAPTSTPASDASAAGAGLVLPLLAIIGAQFLY